MGRYSPSSSYGHRIRRLGHDWYRISWAFDRYYASARLRFPQCREKDTDEAGAKRFAKKWGVDLPAPPEKEQP